MQPRGDKLAVVTQTTLSVDDAAEILAAVKRRFPHVREPKKQDICYATQNRQDAVKVLAPSVDVVIVVGSPTSSNSNRLRELSQRLGTPAYMVDAASDLCAEWFEGRRRVGLTAGASAPDILVQQVIERLRALGAVSVRRLPGVQEDVEFPLPLGLGDRSMAALDAPILTPRTPARAPERSHEGPPCSTSTCCAATWTACSPAWRSARRRSPSWTWSASARWRPSARRCRPASRNCRRGATP